MFDPFSFLHSHLSNLASGGVNIDFVIANDSDELGFQLPANLGHYFIGPGLEQLIQQLTENDPQPLWHPGSFQVGRRESPKRDVCLNEFPTDDPDYESTREASGSGNSDMRSGSGGGGSHSGFRITLP
ncbi:hypothetical protein Acr_29g0005150 [Actinidia rufa]|uniref:Uncharacterized protein n=1 Tax=Actinidia rufa TaxID=165716 RepID=A0A7J0HE20_9ERIC|nr:hypothetical protein Acr_29g0005150 [Actinidia rufa]